MVKTVLTVRQCYNCQDRALGMSVSVEINGHFVAKRFLCFECVSNDVADRRRQIEHSKIMPSQTAYLD